jgi:predicted membrane channel-forming protein YqfA (hemolysin III family)
MEGKKEPIRTSTWVIMGVAVIFILGYLCYQSETFASILITIIIILVVAGTAWYLISAIFRSIYKDYEKYRIEEEKLLSKKNMEKSHKTYTTSRLSSKNVLFPSTITLTDFGIIIRDPVFYAGRESTIYKDINNKSKVSTYWF